ncbi:phospholipase D1-like isoform X1 [Gordionus sp. m RMFG-2023]|uniref:phospholipase D1-like isoform X1 n=1 Tax=Gordionus sp. m RMFG-2023 TaxID=3053472 RepID=UPI0031FCE4DA
MNTISQLINSTIPSGSNSDRVCKAEIEDLTPPTPSILPFAMISQPMFFRMRKQVWLPNCSIEVRISHYIHMPKGNLLNPNVYVINFSHSKYQWNVYKRYKDFQALHANLKLHSAKQHLLFRAAGLVIPHLPPFIDAYLNHRQMPKIMRELEYYLQTILTSKHLRNHEDTLMFCQVSYLSFKSEYGSKGLEDVAKKRSGGYYGLKALNLFKKIFIRWRKRWVVLKDTYFAYSDMKIITEADQSSSPTTTRSGNKCCKSNCDKKCCINGMKNLFFCCDDLFDDDIIPGESFRNSRNISCVMLLDPSFKAHIQTKPPIGSKFMNVLDNMTRKNNHNPNFISHHYSNYGNDNVRHMIELDNSKLTGENVTSIDGDERGGDKDLGEVEHGTRFKMNRLVIQNRSRKLLIKFKDEREADEWLRHINEDLLCSPVARLMMQQQRYKSFAPVRPDSHAFWFVDGASYFSAVADALYSAKDEIFITDWWLSPQYYLKRPLDKDCGKWRLDNILRKKAEDGVKIYIMIYKEVALALGINSFYTKQALRNLHPYNIIVLRHPDHLKSQVYMWAHHEKMVCIDQRICFLGGLDICYARWDDHQHRLTDLGDEGACDAINEEKNYMLNAKRGLLNPESNIIQERKVIPMTESTPQKLVNKMKMTGIAGKIKKAGGGGIAPSRKPSPRVSLGSGSSSVQTKERADIQHDLNNSPIIENDRSSKNILVPPEMNIERHHIHNFPSPFKGRRFFPRVISPPIHPVTESTAGDFVSATAEKNRSDYEMRVYKRQKRLSLVHNKKERDGKAEVVGEGGVCDIDIADDSCYYAKSDLTLNIDLIGSGKYWIGKDYSNFIYKDFAHVDLPYVDLIDRHSIPRMPWHDIGCVVYGLPATDCALHFIERWNYAVIDKYKEDPYISLLLPKTFKDLTVPQELANRAFNCEIQITRSSTTWSAGIKDTEDSIQRAYVQLITEAKRFIYIENQFFITLHDNPIIKNKISDALYDRIAQAIKSNERFKVYIMTPLLPGFEGEIGGQTGACIQTIIHWNNCSMAHGENSLVGRLKKLVDNPFEYISFCSLRNYAELNGNLVTELIYIHSKLMIVDDEYCIIGSANINDRSMLGYRDSELAAIFKDTNFLTMENIENGQVVHTGLFCGSLRKRLFREHLTILDKDSQIDFSDPSSDKFYKLWNQTASQNTSIFEEVFRCIPTDKATNFAELNAYQKYGVETLSPKSKNDTDMIYQSNTDNQRLLTADELEQISHPSKSFNSQANETNLKASAGIANSSSNESKDENLSNIPLAKSNPDLAREKLKNVRGHVVQTPLHFLSVETRMLPQMLSKEGLAPSTVFT